MSDWGERNETALATSAQRRRLEVELDALQLNYNAELAARIEAEKEIDRLKAELREHCHWSWIIARDNSRTCDGCKQTIHRGEAYRWIGEDGHWHVLCPDQERATDA